MHVSKHSFPFSFISSLFFRRFSFCCAAMFSLLFATLGLLVPVLSAPTVYRRASTQCADVMVLLQIFAIWDILIRRSLGDFCSWNDGTRADWYHRRASSPGCPAVPAQRANIIFPGCRLSSGYSRLPGRRR